MQSRLYLRFRVGHSWAFTVRSGLRGLVVEPSTCSQDAWLLIIQSSIFSAFTLTLTGHVVAIEALRMFQQFTQFSFIPRVLSCITYRMKAPIYQSRICQCSCSQSFESRLNYKHRDEAGKATFPIYKRGHHPNCRANQTSEKEPWNKGLSKDDHPSIQRMGFQPGHMPYNDWSHVNELIQNDSAVRARWLESKKGQVAWNKGKSKAEYPNGIKNGPAHGNWEGGKNGIRDQSVYCEFRLSILKRDNYTCQECGDRNRKGRGSRIALEVDHIEPVCLAPDRILDPTNARVLCVKCHYATETFGIKAVKYARKVRGERGGSL